MEVRAKLMGLDTIRAICVFHIGPCLYLSASLLKDLNDKDASVENKRSFDHIPPLRSDKLHNCIQRGIFDFLGVANCFPVPALSGGLL